MIKTFAFVAALLGSALAASAADLPGRSLPPAPTFVQVSAPTWSGVYVGVNGGYAWGEQRLVNGGGPKFDNDGWLAGATIGAQHQFSNNIVLGVEADIAYADIKHSSAYGGGFATVDSKVNSFGTARVRLGYAMGAFLPYVTGGVAYQNTETTLGFNFRNPVAAKSEDTSFGWTIGAGVEYAIARNWSVKGEYLYVNTGRINHSFAFGGPLTIGARTDGDMHVVRAGVNYRF